MIRQQQSSRFKLSVKSMLILSVIILFSCSYRLPAQQKDGEASDVSSHGSSVPRPVNFDIVRLLPGEFLEMVGTDGTQRGKLHWRTSEPAVELASFTDPLVFSTNSTERLRIQPNGKIGVGTSDPQDALHIFDPTLNVGTIRLQGGSTKAGFIGMWDGHMLLLTNNRHPGSGANYNTALEGAQFSLWGSDIQFASVTSGPTGNTTDIMRIKGNGRVGIGTINPVHQLDVQGGAINASGGLCMNGDCKTAWSQVGGGSQWTTSGSNIFYTTPNNVGNVGIGSGAPLAKLHVSGIDAWGTAAFSGSQWVSHFNLGGNGTEDTYIRGGKSTSRVIIGDVNAGVLMALGSGNVGIATATPTAKLHVQGDGKFTGSLTVDGNIAAKYQDVAEWVPAAEQLTAGTVVVLDSTKSNQVICSNKSYDTRVAGVISAQPGITLGEKSDNKVLVATTGRVLVNVDATHGPIQIGDLLVTSDREGFAMKSLPVEIGNARIHRSGTLIGKALGPLASGTGKILVLLSLQ